MTRANLIRRSIGIMVLWTVTAGIGLPAARAAMVSNSATGTINGGSLDLTGATVSLNALSGGGAITSAAGEITPNAVVIGSVGNIFTYDLLPTINGGDTGVDRIVITTPAGYANPSVTGVSVGGGPLTANCPAPGAGQYCAAVAGQGMTVTLGTKVTTSLTHIRMNFTENAPAAAGTADFTATLDDTATAGAPQAVVAGNANGNGGDANSIMVEVKSIDAGRSTVQADPALVQVDFDGDGNPFGAVTVIPKDGNGVNLGLGLTVAVTASDGAGPFGVVTPVVDNGDGSYTARLSAPLSGLATLTAVVNGVTLTAKPQVAFTVGMVLKIIKTAKRRSAVVGDLITYQVEVRNTVRQSLSSVKLHDHLPPHFKYLQGSTIINSRRAADPTGNRTLIFNLGTIDGLVDLNGNGTSDPGEAGNLLLSYQLVVGAGATPGEYPNSAQAFDFAPVSNEAAETVRVGYDPIFDLGTVIGKVFFDENRDGQQDAGETGIARVMVALDDGTYVVTDGDGRFHFPGVSPGERLIKINKTTLPPGTTITTEEARIIQVTRGLLAKVNFGVIYDRESQQIGDPGKRGVAVSPSMEREPIQVTGHMETMQILVNGAQVPLPMSEVRLGMEEVQEMIEIEGGQLKEPILFSPFVEKQEEAVSWRLTILDSKGSLFKEIDGSGAPPDRVAWDGKGSSGEQIVGGEIYQYQLQVAYRDGAVDTSSRRLFGVNQTTAISLGLTGSAFDIGSATLNTKTVEVLHLLAETLRKYPTERITIEGHTDSLGSDKFNLALSEKRARAAMTYLVEKEGIAADRFVLKGLGKSKPMVSNLLKEGREINRRVEIKGEVQEVEKAKVFNQSRSEPKVMINGRPIQVDPNGRFSAEIVDEIDRLNMEIANRQGKVVQTVLPIPKVEIGYPLGPVTFSIDERSEDYKAVVTPGSSSDREAAAFQIRLRGTTEGGNQIWIDGEEAPVSPEGVFDRWLPLRVGENLFGIVVINPQQVSRIVNMRLVLSDRDEKGRWIMTIRPVPSLSVILPPKGAVLSHRQFQIVGTTAPDNQVRINGKEVRVAESGAFSDGVDLPDGKSLLVIEVVDPDGNSGRIEREVEVRERSFFFMALADGEFGRMTTTGGLESSGSGKETGFYEKGRLAYYLKGMIQGKYLITSAFDTGKRQFNQMFRDLDQKQTDRFFTHIDPDKFYPVYGDGSTVVYDAQSQGKFYLAVDGDDLRFLVGNFQTGMTDTELASFIRTLYGARFEYRSLSKTAYGDPDTRLILFASEVRRVHIQNTFRATGGSLYYLSARNVIPGSEKIRVEVRDKNTGLILTQIDQSRDADYTIKYEEGRLLFHQPISGVVDAASLIHSPNLLGHPVFIYINFEYEATRFEKKAIGGRVQRWIGDHLAIGGTYVEGGEAASDYALKGADAILRFGEGSRIVGELAQSRGKSASNLISEDGGLSFNEISTSASGKGSAFKIAGRVDLSEQFWQQGGTPGAKDRLVTEGYLKRLSPEFVSNGTLLEQGSLKYGGGLRYRPTSLDTLHFRYDFQETIPGGNMSSGVGSLYLPSGGANRVTLHEAEWSRSDGPLLLGAAFRKRVTEQAADVRRNDTLAGRLGWRFTDQLTTTLDHQQTVAGEKDRLTTLALRYRWNEAISAHLQGTHGERGNTALVGAAVGLGERARIYMSEKLTKPEGGEALWGTVVGGERRVTDRLRLYTEYELQTGGIEQNRALWGLDQRWQWTEGWKGNFHYERSRLSGSGTDMTRDVASLGIRYDDSGKRRLAHRFEIRSEVGTVKRLQRLTTHNGELKVADGWTLFAKFNYGDTRSRTLDRLEARFVEAGAGIAYRPVSFDRLNLLAKYTRLDDLRPDPLGMSLRTMVNVVSVEAVFDITRRIQWVEKVAVKMRREADPLRPNPVSRTLLSIHRINYHVTSLWDIGLEYRILKQLLAEDQLEGFLVEVNREIAEHLRFGIGYNFSRFSDNDFSENNYNAKGWFVRGQAKF